MMKLKKNSSLKVFEQLSVKIIWNFVWINKKDSDSGIMTNNIHILLTRGKKYLLGCPSGQWLAASFINSVTFSESVTGCGLDERCYI